jgi:uncharacterized integral membrane protein (TIGR00697 family)
MKQVLTTLFIVSLVISNVVANRIIDLGFITMAGGFFCYAMTYLATDVIGELYGKKEANQVVMLGLIGQIIASVLIFVTGLLPALNNNEAYHSLLDSNWVFTLASLTAYFVSQSIDVHIFHKLKLKNGPKWIRNNVSTIVSQLFDTSIFITIGFGIGQGMLWNDFNLFISLLLGQYIVKVFIALLDTPLFYLLTKKDVQNG